MSKTKGKRPGVVQRANRAIAEVITDSVGTMWCAYVFTALALVSLPTVLREGKIDSLVAWIAQTFLQLVLLSVIMVGQSIQSEQSDERAKKTFRDAEEILNAMDVGTDGGLKDVHDLLVQILEKLDGPAS